MPFMSFKAGDPARWLEDILGRIALADQFIGGRPYQAFAEQELAALSPRPPAALS